MWGEFKPALAELAVERLAPMTQRMSELMADPAEIDAILAQGNEKANEIAEKTVQETREIMGIWR